MNLRRVGKAVLYWGAILMLDAILVAAGYYVGWRDEKQTSERFLAQGAAIARQLDQCTAWKTFNQPLLDQWLRERSAQPRIQPLPDRPDLVDPKAPVFRLPGRWPSRDPISAVLCVDVATVRFETHSEAGK